MTIEITRYESFGEILWGFEIRRPDGSRATRQLPCWPTRKEAVACAKFHLATRDYA